MDATSVNAVPDGNQNSVALNRSCEKCRERKIRCNVPVETGRGGERKCTRCVKLSLDCVFHPPNIRKKRKRNETKIRELEQKLRDLQNAVGAYRDGSETTSPPLAEVDRSPHSISTQATVIDQNDMRFDWLVDLAGDPVKCGIVDGETAQSLIHRFRTALAPTYPLVKIDEDTRWVEFKMVKPGLFRAVVTAAAGSVDPQLFTTLFRHTARYLADEVVVQGHKSLELVQALLIMATWHHPAERFQELKFSQYAHMAATMVSDLRSLNELEYDLPPTNSPLPPSDHQVEICRTFLASYFLCSSISLALRRQNQLQHGQWVEDCMIALLKSTTINDNDMRLVEWTRLQRIAEEGLAVVWLDQSSAISHNDLRKRYVLKTCTERLTKWRQLIPDNLITTPMEMHYNMFHISLRESVIYGSHEMHDLRPPYKLRSRPSPNKTHDHRDLEVVHALNQCVSSAGAMARSFLDLPPETLRCVPVIIYARMAYAAVALMKLDITARSLPSMTALLQERIAIRYILSQLLEKLEAAVGQEGFQIPATFHLILSKMLTWYTHFVDRPPSFEDLGDDAIEPMRQLSVGSSEASGTGGSNTHERATAQMFDGWQSDVQWTAPPTATDVYLDSFFSFSDIFTDFNVAGQH